MSVIVDLYSETNNEIKTFLDKFYESETHIDNNLKWEIIYNNPTESSDIISAFIDNEENFKINMWISLDKDFFINVTSNNADKIIRYLFERYPY